MSTQYDRLGAELHACLLCLHFYFFIYFYFIFLSDFFSPFIDWTRQPIRGRLVIASHTFPPFFPPSFRVLFRPFQTVTDLSVAPTSRRRQLTNQSCPRWSSRLETFDWAQKKEGPILEDRLLVGQNQRSLILQSSFFFLFYMQFLELFFGSISPPH